MRRESEGGQASKVVVAFVLESCGRNSRDDRAA